MFRSVIALIPAVFAAPLYAHEGMALHGPLHRLLHAIGTDNVLGLLGLALAVLAVAGLRRFWRAPAVTAKSDTAN